MSLLLAVLASACNEKPSAGPVDAPESPAFRTLSGDEQAVAVISSTRKLSLYGVSRDATARMVVALPGPAGAKVGDVTLSGGNLPRICATWRMDEAVSLRCYEGPGLKPRDLPTDGDELAGAVGLSVSGQQLAWAVRDPRDSSCLLVAQREPGAAPVRLAAYLEPIEDEATLVVNAIAWSGDHVVLASHGWDADVNGSIARVDLDNPPQGWTDAPGVEVDPDYPVISGGHSSTSGSTVLAVLEGWPDDGRERFRAVEAALSKGGSTKVVARAAQGRRVDSVSGGREGVLYATASDTDTRFYWRAPGRAHGTPIKGLPADTRSAIAQP